MNENIINSIKRMEELMIILDVIAGINASSVELIISDYYLDIKRRAHIYENN